MANRSGNPSCSFLRGSPTEKAAALESICSARLRNLQVREQGYSWRSGGAYEAPTLVSAAWGQPCRALHGCRDMPPCRQLLQDVPPSCSATWLEHNPSKAAWTCWDLSLLLKIRVRGTVPGRYKSTHAYWTNSGPEATAYLMLQGCDLWNLLLEGIFPAQIRASSSAILTGEEKWYSNCWLSPAPLNLSASPAEDARLPPSFRNAHLWFTSTTKDWDGRDSCYIATSTPSCWGHARGRGRAKWRKVLNTSNNN